MRINCPFCGDRDVGEFHCLGGSESARPGPGAADAPARFSDYVYMRDNAADSHEELWYHGFGCGAWLFVVRNTVTHEIASVRAAAGEAYGRRV